MSGMRDDARAMDVFEFVRLGREAGGEVALSSLVRFCEGAPEQPGGEAGMLRWSARGEQSAHGEQFLHLHVRAEPVVVCQRCLAPFAWPVDSRVTLQIVRSEAELDADEPSQDDDDLEAPEKVLGSKRFDLLAQIEDELILAVPYITRHEVCPELPEALKEQEAPAERRPSPFAALGQLKSK